MTGAGFQIASADLTIGLRMGGAVLCCWLFWRVAFESWGVTEQAGAVRRRAWQLFRPSVALVCIIALIASGENILRAEGVIGDRTGFWLMSSIALGIMAWAVIIHRALDIATQRRGSTAACAGIAAVSLCYAIGKAAQWTT